MIIHNFIQLPARTIQQIGVAVTLSTCILEELAPNLTIFHSTSYRLVTDSVID
jgi:hypothetical protein